MASRKFYTQDQIESAKNFLSELPDLTPSRLSREDMLKGLAPDMLMLSETKGYSPADIKAALEKADIVVSEKSIQDILRKNSVKKTSRPRKNSATTASASGSEKNAEFAS